MDLTIAIPTFNRCEYLKEAVDSCLKQNIPSGMDVKLIISDNFSTDGTAQYLESLPPRKSQITIMTLKSSSPRTPIENWDTCLENAGSEFFLLLSDDDRLEQNFFFNFLQELDRAERSDIQIFLFSNQLIDEQGNTLGIKRNLSRVLTTEVFLNKLIARNLEFNLCSVIFRTELLKKYSVFKHDFKGSGMYADGGAILCACSRSGKAVVSSKICSSYRIHQGMDSHVIDHDLFFESKASFLRFVEKGRFTATIMNKVKFWIVNGGIFQVIRFAVRSRLDFQVAIKLFDDLVRLTDVFYSNSHTVKKISIKIKILLFKYLVVSLCLIRSYFFPRR